MPKNDSLEDYIKNMNATKEWRFPLEKIPKGKNIIIYGAGEVGKSFWRFLQYTDYCKVVLWVDKNYQKINQDLGENLIHSPEDIKNYTEYDYVLVSMFRKSGIDVTIVFLKDIGVPEDKIITI